MTTEVFELRRLTLSQMLRMQTNLRYAVHLSDIPQAVEDLAGRAPAGDILQIATLRNDWDMMAVANEIDEILFGEP